VRRRELEEEELVEDETESAEPSVSH